jgi:hypothetical protein
MPLVSIVPWADCIRALRGAGFVCAAESPAAVVLVRAGRSVLLRRVPAFDEPELVAALRGAGFGPLAAKSLFLGRHATALRRLRIVDA